MSQKPAQTTAALVLVALTVACSGTNFAGANAAPTPTPKTPATVGGSPATSAGVAPAPTPQTDADTKGTAPNPQPNTDTAAAGLGALISQIAGSIPPISFTPPKAPPSPPSPTVAAPTGTKPCSNDYSVPGTANPYLAGDPSGTTLTYNLTSGGGPNPTDTESADFPVLVVPTDTSCITPGTVLSFSVHGQISYTSSEPSTDANGNSNNIASHQLGSVNGKSNITAPINSLLGVFLGAGDPTADAAPPALDYSTQADRDYTTLTPQIGQVFFIGTGVTSSGQLHQVTVPQGATRLYFAVMDMYQWNNNVGSLNGAILVDQ